MLNKKLLPLALMAWAIYRHGRGARDLCSAKIQPQNISTEKAIQEAIGLQVMGIPNIGNTCYAGAALQLLVRYPGLKIKVGSGELTRLYRDGMSPKQVREFIQWAVPGRRIGAQEDSHHLIGKVLERSLPRDQWIVEESTVSCCSCGRKSTQSTKHSSFLLYGESEVSCNDSETVEYKCPDCGANQAIKTTTRTLPRYFIVKRVGTVPYRYPEKILAAIHHHGIDGSGHYTAVVKKEKEWYRVSDTHVSICPSPRLDQATILLIRA